MILTSTTEPVRFTPQWLDGQADAPVYLVRAGSVRERAQLEAELAGPHRAAKVWGFELLAAMRDGVTVLMTDDPEFDRVMGVVNADEGELDADDRALLGDVRKVLAEHYQPYRDLVAQLERRRELAPIEGARRFVVGVENTGVTFAADRNGMVSEATLAAIDPFELMAVGNFAYSLLYGGGLKGNSPRPGSSAKDPKTSTSDGTSTADGKSRGKGGRKTPA